MSSGKIRVGVFFGGRSVEHEVSIISAIQAIKSFDSSKYEIEPIYCARDGGMYTGAALGEIESYRDIPALLKKSRRVVCAAEGGRLLLVNYPVKRFAKSVHSAIDVAFPIVHGTNVEDGALQGFFRTLSIPFVGCDVTASAVGMDKYIMKTILKDNRIPVLDCVRISVKSYFKDVPGAIRSAEEAIPYPMIVKPVNLGSSIGIKLASNGEELKEAFSYAFLYADTALAERAVPNLREINCAVLGDCESAIASECEEPVNTAEILSYEDKYISGGKSGAKGMSAAKRKLPAELAPETRETIRDLAVRTFQSLGCGGVSRIDFLMDGKSGEIWVNEINTIPGSLSFYLWTPVGIPYSELLDRLIDLALKREREKENIAYSFETNILTNFVSGGLKGIKR
ncbi:MAG: D-alanine--D-alanine ligase [Synergistaceae bacterium]|jgi:D-alanine-D-alanine ligase|nr:D-alanine--D-alanine ligase [Synergistaceae bacterium]